MKYSLDWDDGTHSYEARYVRLSSDRVVVFIRDFTVEEWQRSETKQLEATAQPVDEMEHRMEWRNPYGLSYREFGVLHLLKNGTTDKEIAGELGISVFTVNKHVSNILTKMRAASRTEATIRALQEGLIK
jgi:DNA-binding NarL/FixJ family response regulator